MRRRALLWLGAGVLATSAPAGLVLADPPPIQAGGGTDGVDAVTRGPSFEERIAAIRECVQAAATYPALAQLRRLEGTSIVGFEITPAGEPLAVEVAASSGFPVLDRAAAQAVRDAAKLPWVYGRIEIPVRFELMARSETAVP